MNTIASTQELSTEVTDWQEIGIGTFEPYDEASELSPARISYIHTIAGKHAEFNWPTADTLLPLSHDELKEFVNAIGYPEARNGYDQICCDLLYAAPHNGYSSQDEREKDERLVIALARAIAANWPDGECG